MTNQLELAARKLAAFAGSNETQTVVDEGTKHHDPAVVNANM